MIPEGGFKELTVAGQYQDNKSYYTLKTQDLIENNVVDKNALNDEEQYNWSNYMLNQFKRAKNIMHNLSHHDKGKNVLSVEIILHIIDEVKSERKIAMVLKSVKDIDSYVLKDITDIKMDTIAKDPSLLYSEGYDEKTKNILLEKIEFREKSADMISMIKVNDTYSVLKKMYGIKTFKSTCDGINSNHRLGGNEDWDTALAI